MALNHYWESFIRKHEGKAGSRDIFENLMLELTKAENPGKEVHRVVAFPGDGGIDIQVQQDNGIDIYQCKFFTDKLGDSQRDQIRKSFNKAMEDKGLKVLRWFLCMPREQELQEISWVHNFIKERSDKYGIEIHFIYGTEITNRMEAVAPELIEKYFPITAQRHFTNKALIVPFTKEDSNGEQGGTYIPRDDLLSKIADSFLRQSGNKRMVFLSGMGGCGKSELARAYAERHSSAYEEIFWLTCTDGIRPDLLTLMSDADTLCDVEKEDAVAFSDKVLIIVDNCNSNDAKFLRELEHGTGLADILVSTRLRYIGSYKNIISIESDEPEKFTFEVFEKNYCKIQPWGEPKEIKEDEICSVHDICRAVQYNTMIVALIGLRLCEYDNLSITDCAQKIRTGVGSIKGTFDYSKDLDPRSEEMKDVLHFLFSDILYPTVPVTIEQREILSALSLTPATWYEGNYIYSLTGGGAENTNHAYAAKKLLSFGWLQGSADRISIHPLIAEAISGEPIAISEPKFYCKLLNNYLGLQEKYLSKNRFLINEIIKRSSDALPEAKIVAMLLINHGGYKKLFAECFPNVSSAYFVYEAHGWNRFFYYRDLDRLETCSLICSPCQIKEDDSVNLLKVYSNDVPYVLDLSIKINNKTITKIPAGICYKDLNLNKCLFPEHILFIGDGAFSGCSNLSGKLLLPNDLAHIGDTAFDGCSGLSGELHLPDALTTIGDWAFQGCSGLSGELHLPDTLTTIGNHAFHGCSGLSGELHLPDALTTIGDAAFFGCSGLSGELHLPDTLTSIGDAAFHDCSGLSGELHLPDALTSFGEGAFQGCSGLSGELHLPDALTSIGDAAFHGCSGLSGELYLPDTLTSIGDWAFHGCSGLSGELYLPDTLTSIGDWAFQGCSSLSGELHLPNGLTSIGDWAFHGCSGLSGELHLPVALTTIGKRAFQGCSGLSGELHLPVALTTIGERAFHGCSGLSGELHLPVALTTIGDAAFDGCPGLLGELHLPDGLTSIVNGAFNGCSGLSGELHLPDGLTSIVNGAFDGCSGLSGELHLPDALTIIGDWAFHGCSGLSGELHLPDALTTIGVAAFFGCSHLSGELHLPDALTTIGDAAFFGCSGLSGELHLPDGLTSFGEGAFAGCSGLSGELHLPDALTTIGDWAFHECSGLSGELHLPDALTTIGDWAFHGCSGLSGELHLPDALTTIGNHAFDGCSGLSGGLHLPDGLTCIGEGAFSGCSGLSGELHLPDALTSIGDWAFSGCSGLSGELHLPDSLTSIGDWAFHGCSGLSGELHLPDSLTSIGKGAFSDCSGLSGGLRLPDGLTSIGKGAFSGCSGLSGKLRLPDGLTSIGKGAFFGCSGLSGELHMPDSLTNIDDESLNGCNKIEKLIFHNPYTTINGRLNPFSSTIICGYRNSTAEEYALKNGLVFEEMRPTEK